MIDLAANSSSDLATDSATLRAQVPANYRRGARQTWHQRRRHAAVLGMLQGLSGRVLDYGCGYGDLAYAMSQTHETCGVDLDPRRVAFAQAEYAPLEFKQCSAEEVPYADASFDIVTSIVVLNFISDASAHLRSIRRLLKPGGHLVLACKNIGVVRKALRSMLGRGPVPSKLWMRPRSEVRQLLQEQQFLLSRESHFYDPPMSGWKNLSDAVTGSIEQILSVAGLAGPAGYFLMLAQKS